MPVLVINKQKTMVVRYFCILFTFVFFASLECNGKSIKIFKSTDVQSNHNKTSGARLKNPPKVSISDLTICLRFYEYLRLDSMLVNSRPFDYDDPFIFFSFYDKLERGKFESAFAFLSSPMNYKKISVDWAPLRWHHVCFSYDSGLSRERIVSNGEIVLDGLNEAVKDKSIPIPEEIFANFFIMRKGFPETAGPQICTQCLE